ncbi:Transposon Ty3-I Gag-Pol polyprotein [Aphis craccivora]|uniref:Transposon Ty3-I Gag-Pol polyprotein n=1 Tax=Aphis craccivora TaxID=307492 RepID=A0A6G0VMK9_APHCR|nr:Transposon Ty3-I Gag-Pol polyprotein [Aphis craccivora]
MQKKINPFYTARNLTKNIKRICKRCTVCIKNKSRGQDKIGLMSHLGPSTRPFEIVSIDTIGGFGGSRSTKKYLHLLVDHFTRYAYIVTSRAQNASDFIKLVKNITKINNIGMILTDQYPGINSKEFKKFLDESSIPIIFTAVNAPFSNGLNERLNQTLVNKIRCVINGKERKMAWTTIAHECVKKYNETEHTVTGFAPEYLLNGTDVTMLPKELKQEYPEHSWIQNRKKALKNTIISHNYNKKLFDKNRKYLEFNIGDKVFVENGNRLNRKKLDELKIGPYEITEKLSNSIYRVNTDHRKAESNLYHITKLIPAPAVEEDDYGDEKTDGDQASLMFNKN